MEDPKTKFPPLFLLLTKYVLLLLWASSCKSELATMCEQEEQKNGIKGFLNFYISSLMKLGEVVGSTFASLSTS